MGKPPLGPLGADSPTDAESANTKPSIQAVITQQASISTLSRAQGQIVKTVSAWLTERGATIKAVHSVKFGSDYSTNFQFEASEAALDRIRSEDCLGEVGEGGAAVRGLEKFGAHFRDQPADDSQATNTDPLFQLNVYGFDCPGIIAELSALIESQRPDEAAILGMSGISYAAPLSRKKLFVVQMKLSIAESLGGQQLRDELTSVVEEHGWRFSLTPLTPTHSESKTAPRKLRVLAANE